MSYFPPFQVVEVKKVMPYLYKVEGRFRNKSIRKFHMISPTELNIGNEVAFKRILWFRSSALLLGKNMSIKSK